MIINILIMSYILINIVDITRQELQVHMQNLRVNWE